MLPYCVSPLHRPTTSDLSLIHRGSIAVLPLTMCVFNSAAKSEPHAIEQLAVDLLSYDIDIGVISETTLSQRTASSSWIYCAATWENCTIIVSFARLVRPRDQWRRRCITTAIKRSSMLRSICDVRVVHICKGSRSSCINVWKKIYKIPWHGRLAPPSPMS